ncbi:MAG: hypothetical protein H6730_09120 [Deltaproteobacteria bacterium]|nr:hypothetical protein [Deltaproteobacteria bacterium]
MVRLAGDGGLLLLDGAFTATATAVSGWPLASRTATLAEAAWRAGRLACGPRTSVPVSALADPVTGRPLSAPVPLPVVAPVTGRADVPGAVAVALGTAQDLATFRSAQDGLLPVRPTAPRVVVVPGGAALELRLVSPWAGVAATAFAPVLRLGLGGAPAEHGSASVDAAPLAEQASAWVGAAAAARLALDATAGMLTATSTLTLGAPGFGARHLTFAPAAPVPDRGPPWGRLALTHGVGLGVPLLLYATAFIGGPPKCRLLCDDTPPLGVDAALLARVRARSPARLETLRRWARGVDLALFGLALVSTLAPSARHGVLSRWEILEDALILGEGVFLAYTGPQGLRVRFGRARPRAHHPVLGPDLEPEDAVGPAFFALGANRSGAWLGGVMAMLLAEDAPWGYTLTAGLLVGGLGVASAWLEVEAGYAYPSDVPLGFITGVINGAGMYLWHRLFWPGWPGGARGALPLRLQGVTVTPLPGGAGVGASLAL